jgi:hypothetical protein
LATTRETARADETALLADEYLADLVYAALLSAASRQRRPK